MSTEAWDIIRDESGNYWITEENGDLVAGLDGPRSNTDLDLIESAPDLAYGVEYMSETYPEADDVIALMRDLETENAELKRQVDKAVEALVECECCPGEAYGWCKDSACAGGHYICLPCWREELERP